MSKAISGEKMAKMYLFPKIVHHAPLFTIFLHMPCYMLPPDSGSFQLDFWEGIFIGYAYQRCLVYYLRYITHSIIILIIHYKPLKNSSRNQMPTD